VSDQDAWDARYRSSKAFWSGDPNPQLVAEISSLKPGRALDAGCREGADAVWLAERGWQVTALDISSVALEHARDVEICDDVARRIDWQHADLTTQAPAKASYDVAAVGLNG